MTKKRKSEIDFEIAFYEGVEHEHAGDCGVVAMFRKR
jgi:hypothetical protein